MKRITEILMMLFSLTMGFGVASCSPDDDQVTEQLPTSNPNPNPDPNMKPRGTSNQIKITVDSSSFTATLQDNQTTNAFKKLLPMTINMSELNNNEKYYSLPNSLPTNASNLGTIQNGDLMLYGTSTLVLFYKTFSTSYSYSKIGGVDNPSGLQTALGSNSVTVTLELQ